MIEGTPSKMALRVAVSRAAHQEVDGTPRVFDDPFALRILGPEGPALLAQGRFGSIPSRRMRSILLARSRIAEDELAQAVQRGVRQYVVLGAGLDTFACRNPYPPDVLRVFEVDHPSTQRWKRDLLAQAGVAAPPATSFVPVDFEAQSWLAQLQQAGFRADLPTHVSWLGVAMYLAPDQVLQVLAQVATLPRGSSIVFDYLLANSQLGFGPRLVMRVLGALVRGAGEPLKSQFVPGELRTALLAAGFAEVEDSGPRELNERFFAGRSDGLMVGAIGHIVRARV